MDRAKNKKINSRRLYILHYLFPIPQEKQVTSKQTTTPPTWNANSFLSPVYTRGLDVFIFSPSDSE